MDEVAVQLGGSARR